MAGLSARTILGAMVVLAGMMAPITHPALGQSRLAEVACNDGLDNDGDGHIDLDDFGEVGVLGERK